jgi:hypothetical protein
MTSTADTLVPEQLWQAVQPLLPIPPRRYGGRLAGTRGPVPGRRDGVRDARGATRYDTNTGRGLMWGPGRGAPASSGASDPR